MNTKLFFSLILFIILFVPSFAAAQTTEFTYQGRFNDSAGTAASYDFEFRLFASASGGAALGTQTRPGVPVSDNVFTVQLDFGGQFDGTARYLEIGVKPAGSGGGFTILAPRQPITSTPYAVRSLNAGVATNSTQLGGVAANQFVQTTDTRLTDARNPLPNSGNYVQNTTTQQTASNFNIAGDGTAGGTLSGNAVNSTTQYNIGGSRVLTTSSFSGNIFAGNGAGAVNGLGGDNSFFGQGSGQSNVSGGNNSFFGKNAGNSNTVSNNSFFGEQSGFGTSTGGNNSFFGQFSGRNNQTGGDNAFFGYRAGANNTASGNSFFGSGAGDSVTSGANNAFFGRNAGAANLTGEGNSFFGYNAGVLTTVGGNSFFGRSAGDSNTTGARNSFFGYNAGQSVNTNGDNSFFGYNAGGLTRVGSTFFSGTDNSFFGSRTGELNFDGQGNSFFGAGAGNQSLGGSDNVFIGRDAGDDNTFGNNNTVIGAGANVGLNNLNYATAIGAGAVVENNGTIVIGRLLDTTKVGNLQVGNNATFGIGGTTRLGNTYVDNVFYLPGTAGISGSTSTLCISDTTARVGTCASSLRYKTNVQTFTGGLDVVRRLRPITFNWIGDGASDVGFAAEEVEQIEPLLTHHDKNGTIQSVKYAQITTVLVNAVIEQQTQIEEQKKQIESQQQQIDGLRKLVCQNNPQAEVCKREK